MRRRKIKIPGSVYLRANGRWTAQTYEGRGERRRRSLGTFDTRDDAEEALERHVLLSDAATKPQAPETGAQSARAYGQRLDEAAEQMVGDYLRHWLGDTLPMLLETKRLARSTVKDYRGSVVKHMLPHFSNLRIADLSPRHLRDWLDQLRQHGLSDRSVVKLYGILRLAFADSDLPTNPILLPRRDRPVVRSTRQVIRPTVEDVTAFLDHVRHCPNPGGESMFPLWRLLVTTGLRRSEACGLTWDDLECRDGTWRLTVSRGLHIDSGTLYTRPPKTRTGHRSIRLDEATAATLTAYEQATRLREVVKVETPDGQEEFDFAIRWGPALKAMNPDTVTRLFPKEWKHAELRPGVTLKGTRHSHGSALLQEGMSVTEAAAHLGHSPQVLLTIYARDLDEARRHQRLAATVERLYG